MENDFINITNEDLEKLSFEELADLKIELDDLVSKVNDMLKTCDDILNKKI
jgi:hypothetical protein